MKYRGEDNLAVMNLAQNHIRYIEDEILRACPPAAKDIVDFGAGNGLYARRLQSHLQTPITCVEPADNMLPYLDGLRVVKDISLLTAAADFIYSLDVLEHIADDETTLKQLFSQLKRGGVLFLHVPAFQSLYSAMDKKVGHFRRYSRSELINKCRAAGFEVDDCRYMDFCGFFASLLYKAAPAADGSLNPRLLTLYDKLVIPASSIADALTLGRVCGKNLILTAHKGL